jgi:hypothetical protein
MQCNMCKTLDITEQTMYFDGIGSLIGTFPLYYVGNPTTPHLAEIYFCGAYCSNNYYKELRND